MKKVWRGIRLLGRWEDVTIQGTSRTYQIYAYHPLDRLMSLGVILFLWTVLFFFAFCRSPGPPASVWMHYLKKRRQEFLTTSPAPLP